MIAMLSNRKRYWTGVLVVLIVSFGVSSVLARTKIKTLSLSGSMTIGELLGKAWAEDYQRLHPDVEFNLNVKGSSKAIEKFVAGETDFIASTRYLSKDEILKARENNITPREIIIGFDGLAIVVNEENLVDRLTLTQVALIFDGTIDDWAVLGGPERTITRYIPPEGTGTMDYFRNEVMKGRQLTDDRIVMNAFPEIADAVRGDISAIAFMGSAFAGGKAKSLAIAREPGGEYIFPTVKNIHAASYPLFRSLLLYVNGKPEGLIKDFVDYTLSSRGQKYVLEYKFVPLDIPELYQRKGSKQQLKLEPGQKVATLWFKTRSMELENASKDKLREFAEALASAKIKQIKLVGHSDNIFEEPRNAEIAYERANQVKNYLVRNLGVESFILTESYGSKEPLALNGSFEGRSKNRRVEIWVE